MIERSNFPVFFSNMRAHGLEMSAGKLAFGLREACVRLAAIRRVFKPNANGKLRPAGIPAMQYRVCMAAAMLVFESIFEEGPSAIRKWMA